MATNLGGQADDDLTTVTNPAANQPNNQIDEIVVEASKIYDKEDRPDKRLKNPLANFASYTYQISLYMITPDAYDEFIQSGRKNITILNNAASINDQGDKAAGGAYLLAQSGGINNTTYQRAPGFELDYYIDNLKITTATNAKSTQTSTNTTSVSFNIIEPYGFSFVSNLRKASNALQQYSQSLGYKNLQNPSRQFYILGIRFYGYDINGNLLTGKENLYDSVLDPEGTTGAIFEKFYDIMLTKITFKIDGKATVYSITAFSAPVQEAFGVKRGRLNNGAIIEAATVRDAIDGPKGILTKLNNEQTLAVKNGEIEYPNIYKVKFIGDSADIENASIVLPSDLDKWKWGSSKATTTTESSDALAIKTTPDNLVRTITFNQDTAILQAISQVIAQSSYLENALKTIYTTALEPDTKKKVDVEIKPKTKKTISWYNSSAELSNIRWDSKLGDFAYTITFIIQPYETPVIQNAYTNPGVKYYGPHKRYDYWYTGQNSEVLSYEQRLDNLYYNVGLAPSDQDVTSTSVSGQADVPIVRNRRQPESRLGKLDQGMEAQNAYITDLTSPDAYAKAKVTIMGDPDFLIQESSSSINTLYKKFYGYDGFTINANGGQVFIEIDFKEAQDYKNKTGLLSINESILFWKYPKSVSSLIKGVSYMVITVTSNFSSGKFTQVLDCNINTFPDLPNDDQKAASTTGPATSASNATTQNTGFLPDTKPPIAPVSLAPSPLVQSVLNGPTTLFGNEN